MHAAIVKVTIEEGADPEMRVLKEEVVPMVKSLPGFIHGYWLRGVDGKAMSLVLFETEDQARAAAPAVGSNPAPGVTIDSADFQEVAAHA